MATDQLILGTFEQCFRQYFYDELIVGKLAHSEFKTGVKKGDEVDVIMPGTVLLSKYDGEGDLDAPEEITTSSTKVRIDQGKSFHFFMKDIEKKQIENAPDLKQKVNIIKEYANDAVKQFAAAVDQAYANLYTRAGHYVDDNGDALVLSENNVKELMSYMQAKFKRGDRNGHTNWIDGQMICIVPPEVQFYLTKMQDYEYVESGHRKMEKGLVGKLAGWDIMVSNNIASVDENGKTVFYPLFGIKGKTLAGGVSSNLNTKSYMPERNFNTAYKGYGLFGVGAPRADFLGAAKIEATMTIGQ
jgi:hypothetical protein